MLFERIASEGLAHNSYVAGDGGEAVVIDPRRDVDVYLRIARERELRIVAICETHRNEDYAIGSTALAAATGAPIFHGAALPFEYGTALREGDEIGAGRLRIRALETPGHTPESLTFTLADTRSGSDPVIAFTGDALFVGDTGRVDLLGPEEKPRLARMLHDSLFETILPLGDSVILCPGHGGGSVCGGDISDRDQSTLGYERRNNPALIADRDVFIERKIAEPHLKPPYFSRMEEWNLRGNAPIFERLPVPPPIDPGELAEHLDDGVLVIDARMPQAFAGGHIPGSINIWRAGLSSYLGWVAPLDARLALVLAEDASVEDVTRTLTRIGYDDVVGVLRGGFESWQNQGREIGRLETIDTASLRARIRRGDDLAIIDVRRPSESDAGTIPGALRMFVGDLASRPIEVSLAHPVVAMCSVGHRGGIAASLLARRGYQVVYNYLGGYNAWTS